jgi:hypothetical protein
LLVGAIVVAFGVAASPSYATGGGGQLPGITINGNAGFTTCGGCVVSGSGTQASPYVIGPWAITSPNSQGAAITVENTTADFTITAISANYSDTNPADPVIHLENVTGPANVTNVSANNDGIGVEIDSSRNIALDSISVNKMNGAGLVINNSTNISTTNSKYKATQDGEGLHNEDGLYAVNSSFLHIGGQSNCPQGVCNTFDYDSGWGVYLKDTHDVTIDNASANADDTAGFVLDGSNTYNVNLENSTSEAGGPICITVNGLKVPTGYFNTDLIGGLMLVNGTHNDTISNDTFNGTSAASGYSIGDGGNPFYYNVCTKTDTFFNPPPDGPMGSNITFSNICYTRTDDPTPPPSSCKS